MKVRDLIKLWPVYATTPSNKELRLLLLKNADITVKAYSVFVPSKIKTTTETTTTEIFGKLLSSKFETGLELPLHCVFVFKSKSGKWVAVQNSKRVSLSTAISAIRNSELQSHLEITKDMKEQMLLEDL